MKNGGHASVNETAPRRTGATKARRARSRKNGRSKTHGHHNSAPNAQNQNAPQQATTDEHVSEETVARAKGLLAATLRVWELKHRIHD